MSRTVQASKFKKKKRKDAPPSYAQIRKGFDAFVQRSHPGVEVALKTAFGALQGGGLGYMMGAMMKNAAQTSKQQGAEMNPMLQQMQQGTAATPWGQARGLAALCGVSSGVSVALKKLRNGKDDVWTQMGAAAAGGAAFTIANGNYSVPAIVNSALVLGLFTGAATKVMEQFKPQHSETEFERSKFLLQSLGLSKYEKNLKRGLLTDNTIMLWNESALQEVKIPAGPRLLILHHLDQFRSGHARMESPPPALPKPEKSETAPPSDETPSS